MKGLIHREIPHAIGIIRDGERPEVHRTTIVPL